TSVNGPGSTTQKDLPGRSILNNHLRKCRISARRHGPTRTIFLIPNRCFSLKVTTLQDINSRKGFIRDIHDPKRASEKTWAEFILDPHGKPIMPVILIF